MLLLLIAEITGVVCGGCNLVEVDTRCGRGNGMGCDRGFITVCVIPATAGWVLIRFVIIVALLFMSFAASDCGDCLVGEIGGLR